MALSIDSARAFLSSEELRNLAAAVRDAGEHDEGMWIEWKEDLPLGTPQARVHLVKHILGFANRDPGWAARRADGFAYLLIGVEPGNVHGVTTIDHSTMEQQLKPYVGPHVVWTSEYIKLDGKDVLVITVDPPRVGDRIHYLRKPLPSPRKGESVHAEHTVFVRRNAQTMQANDGEMEMLQRRSAAAPNSSKIPYLEIDVLASRLRDNDPITQRNSLAMLEQLGIEHSSMRQLVVDNVCQFIRDASNSTADASREFAQAVLTRRLTGLNDRFEPVGGGGAWEDIDIDLTGARLVDLNWQGGRIGCAIFRGATFVGDTCISEVEFRHLADFSKSSFEGVAAIKKTRFDSCNFVGATFWSDCTFFGSIVNGVAEFVRTTFRGETSFRRVMFANVASFRGSHFEKMATFEKAEFRGDVYFDRSHFVELGHFEVATFHQAASFREIFCRGGMDFSHARLLSSSLRLSLPPGWVVAPYPSCVAIVREREVPEVDKGKRRPMFGSGYCSGCSQTKACGRRR
jgi:uncharacterized protein YjbI with pentapeptide repeats